ncbi:metallophosphoesterase family protein [Candidatus Magnetominusculus dajiuhuensis]|uniref:metallophosphoesterase family protein n=1 Tax=Candidatus Magnetominusculus dajiuhuensis TaxID=3137712 RepID=UPI003B439DC4
MGMDRRDFLRLIGIGGAVIVMETGNLVSAADKIAAQDTLTFVQLSDTHWGFNDPKITPDFAGTLKKGIAQINSMKSQPDFIIFTGDITHSTDDPKERRRRMGEAREIIGGLKVKDIKMMPGEHDAGLDNGEAFQEYFGKTHYTFQHKGVHFIVVDNASDPSSSIGDTQLQWLSAELGKLDKDSRIVIFAHRPLFDLYPQWDWWTSDGAKAIDILMPYKNVVVFYGHIHQEHHHMTGHIEHHAAKGMLFPLPAPGSVPKRVQLPWDSAHPYKGVGYRSATPKADEYGYVLTEFPIIKI